MVCRSLFIVASLLALCLCSPQKKNCNRPTFFNNVGELADYVTCLRNVNISPPYGKRSVEQPSVLIQKLLREYDPDYIEELIYKILKTKMEMEA